MLIFRFWECPELNVTVMPSHNKSSPPPKRVVRVRGGWVDITWSRANTSEKIRLNFKRVGKSVTMRLLEVTRLFGFGEPVRGVAAVGGGGRRGCKMCCHSRNSSEDGWTAAQKHTPDNH